jgi:hypothetical protein
VRHITSQGYRLVGINHVFLLQALIIGVLSIILILLFNLSTSRNPSQ